jgi:hypothetical protein
MHLHGYGTSVQGLLVMVGALSRSPLSAMELSLAPDGFVAVVEGKACRSKTSLFDEWARAWQFPAYFGKNWDAFDECFNDLEWLDGNRRVVGVVSNADEILVEEPPEQLAVFLDIVTSRRRLRRTGKVRNRRVDSLLLHAESGKEQALRTLLKRHGVTTDSRSLGKSVAELVN